jgi:hypothetical protein
MKVCFSARSKFGELSLEIFKELIKEKYDIQGVFIANNANEYARTKSILSSVASSDFFVYDVSAYLKENWQQFSADRLGYFESKYNCTPIWKYIYTDRFLVNYDINYVTKTTVGLFAFYELVFQNENVQFYYDETLATLQSYIAYIVSRKFEIKYISQMTARGFDGTHHYLLSDPMQKMCGFRNDYSTRQYN